MTQEQLEKLREKYKVLRLGKSWNEVEKFVSGAYQDIKELLDEIGRVSAERDKAIEDIKHPSVCEKCKRTCQGDVVCIDNGYMDFDWRGMDLANCGEQDPWKKKIMDSFTTVT